MKKGLIVGALLAAIVSVPLIMNWLQSASEAPAKVPAPDSLRTPASGMVLGFRDRFNTHAWLGIPYAEAPIGDLRWQAPRPMEPWSDQRQALTVGSPCIQFWGEASGLDGAEGDIVGSEDCLYLNIWAPQGAQPNAGDGLPVMLWIHGGGNSIGTANTYFGAKLAGSQNVIVVTVNYRLGLMGWFSHQAIRDTALNPEDASGNYGLLDMIAALRWVNENIAAFGGNPNNITIFGESAGGANVNALLASPLASGLFHRAISQSGTLRTIPVESAENSDKDGHISFQEVLLGMISPEGPEMSRDSGQRAVSQMDSQQIMAYLRAKSPQELLSPFKSKLGAFGMLRTPNNIRDGYVLPKESLLSLFQDADKFNAVPLILGTNRDEEKIFMAMDPRWVDQLFGVIPRVKDQVAYDTIAAYGSDSWRALAVDEPAMRISSHSPGSVFAYRFDWDEQPANWLVNLPELIGAGHGIDVSFVFGDFDGPLSFPGFMTEENEPERLILSDAMMGYWAEFAYNGAPGRGRQDKLPEWKAWDNQGQTLILLDTEADGGIRMTGDRITAQSIKSRLAADPGLKTQQQRCQLYVQLFLTGYQTQDFWSEQEYSRLGENGCKQLVP